MATPPEHFHPVVIYDPKDGPPARPANAPPGMVLFYLPANGRDQPEVLDDEETTAMKGDTQREAQWPSDLADEEPRWREETF